MLDVNKTKTDGKASAYFVRQLLLKNNAEMVILLRFSESPCCPIHDLPASFLLSPSSS
jgi:hypothetical protein